MFSGGFFGGGFYGANTRGLSEKERKRRIYKPTGLPPYREIVERRVEEISEIHKEVVREARKTLTLPKPIREMSLAEIEHEIGVRLREQMKKEEEDLILMLLVAAVAG